MTLTMHQRDEELRLNWPRWFIWEDEDGWLSSIAQRGPSFLSTLTWPG